MKNQKRWKWARTSTNVAAVRTIESNYLHCSQNLQEISTYKERATGKKEIREDHEIAGYV